MFCPNCGSEMGANSKFCGKCGYKNEKINMPQNNYVNNAVPPVQSYNNQMVSNLSKNTPKANLESGTKILLAVAAAMMLVHVVLWFIELFRIEYLGRTWTYKMLDMFKGLEVLFYISIFISILSLVLCILPIVFQRGKSLYSVLQIVIDFWNVLWLAISTGIAFDPMYEDAKTYITIAGWILIIVDVALLFMHVILAGKYKNAKV